MPAIGLGTSPMEEGEAEAAVATGIEAGYRLIDTAEQYRNERWVGRGIARSGVDRAELFVTSKFNGPWHGVEGAREAFAASADRLGVEYLDLFLIHWPMPWQDRYVDAWRGLIALLEAGDLRAIGVSNFKPDHLDRLIAETGVAPHVNQIQLNPEAPREAERRYHAEHGILTESWAPLGGAGAALLTTPQVAAVAGRLGRTPAQVVLRWHLELGVVPIPKSTDPKRQRDNIGVFDFRLSPEDMETLSALDRHGDGVFDSDHTGH
jgi:2,5-diketo-D-gluconate reductase A